MILYLILLSFYLVAQADVIEIGLPPSDGIKLIRETIGPIEDSKDPNTSERIADFACEFNVGLSDDNEEDVTNEANFVYPCGSNKMDFDYDCIRKFFADNSDCCPVSGQVLDPLFLAQMTGLFPSINTSGTFENIAFEGLSNAAVSEFYYNKKTGKLVFAIEVPVMYAKTPRAYFIYRRPGRENIIKSGYANGTFRSLIFTAIIPSVQPFGKLRLDFADISGYVGDSNSIMNLDPALTDSTIARADVIEIGLRPSDGIELIRDIIGPIEDSNDPKTSERIADFACEFNVGLSDDNEDDVTNEANFVYPCGSNKSYFDYDCIRGFFAANSDCYPISGQVPDPLVVAQMTGIFPSINMTGTYENIMSEGLSKAAVNEFYYNKKTGKLVFAIEVPVINCKTKAYFTYRRPGRENIVKSGYAYGAFKSLIFTAIIPSVQPFGKLRLDLADISGYVGDSNPDIYLDSTLTDSTNPVVVAESRRLFELLPVVLNELFYIQSPLFTAVYIQTNICDFGVKLYSI